MSQCEHHEYQKEDAWVALFFLIIFIAIMFFGSLLVGHATLIELIAAALVGVIGNDAVEEMRPEERWSIFVLLIVLSVSALLLFAGRVAYQGLLLSNEGIIAAFGVIFSVIIVGRFLIKQYYRT